MAADYAGARPPYPPELYDTLARLGAIGPGIRVLEMGAGSGLATRELVARGCAVTAVEPGPRLAALLAAQVPQAEVVVAPAEEAEVPAGAYDTVVAATALHWVDLGVALPRFHAALRPGGLLAAWRHTFADPARPTAFRARVAEVVARRGPGGGPGAPDPTEPGVLAGLGGEAFAPVLDEAWSWSVDLTPAQVRALFRTFSDWSPDEVEAVGRAADELAGAPGGTITEHYRSALTVLRRVDG